MPRERIYSLLDNKSSSYIPMEFRHKPHLQQQNKAHKKSRTKSGGKIEVTL